MGGEPTFVSIDDMDGAEWNTTALGPEKYRARRQADPAPARSLRAGRLSASRAGQMVSGRIAAAMGARTLLAKDGQPIWRDPALVADEDKPGIGTHGERLAGFHRRAGRAARRRTAMHALPGYEDVWYYLWKERRLPVNVDPFDNKLDERRRPRAPGAHFRAGTRTRSSAMRLPLRREYYTDGTSAWVSGAWFFRPERMYLIPGDSPMGFRLPLDSIPVGEPSRNSRACTSRIRWRRAPPTAAIARRCRGSDMSAGMPRADESAGLRRAGARDPTGAATARSAAEPLVASGPAAASQGESGALDHSHRSVHARCATACCASSCRRSDIWRIIWNLLRRSKTPPPIWASRARSKAIRRRTIRACNAIKVTPDPGVIEVNTQPVGSWDDLVKNTDSALRRSAPHAASAPKNSCSTAGIPAPAAATTSSSAAPTPADSPLLRKPGSAAQPDRLLAQPSVAVVSVQRTFRRPHQPGAARRRSAQRSGLRAGNRVQADSRHGKPARHGWSIASSAICWSTRPATRTARNSASTSSMRPNRPSGRLGLLEMRAFEMPPHARMSLTQHLLLRALIAKFWKQPYRRRRWCAGGRRFTIVSCCRISCSRIWRTWSPI